MTRSASLERRAIAAIATSLLALPSAHGLAFFLRGSEALASPPAALALSLATVACVLLLALARRIAGELGGVLVPGALLGAACGAMLFAQSSSAACALCLLGPLMSWGGARFEALLPPVLDGVLRSRTVASLLWLSMGLASVAQTARISSYHSDPSLAWGPVLPGYFEQHTCLAAYLHAAELNANGESNIYDPAHYPALDAEAQPLTTVAGMQPYLEDPYQYPPPFLLLPHAALAISNDFRAIRMTWFVLQSLLFFGTSLALARFVGGRAGGRAALFTPLVWMAIPSMLGLQYGQFHLAALCLAVLGMMAFELRRLHVGGALLSFAIVAKLFPLVLLVPLLAKRRFAAVGWTVGYASLISLAGFVVLGPASYVAFFDAHLPRLLSGEAFAFGEAWPEMSAMLAAANQSPLGLVQKLGELGVVLPAPSVTLLNALFSVLVLALAVIAGRRATSPLGSARVWLALLTLAAMRSGGAWADYIMTAGLWMLALCESDARQRASSALLGLGWLLLFFLPGIVPLGGLPSLPVMMGLSLVGFFAALGLGAWGALRAPLMQRSGEAAVVRAVPARRPATVSFTA